MNEIFPLVAGAAIGLLSLRITNGRRRITALVALSVIFGMLATILSGEIALSWGFFPVDIALALTAAVATAMLATVWPRRPRPNG